MPLWQNLRQGDVAEKTPDEIVTIADRSCESFLMDHLPKLIEGSLVLGEESVHANPSLLSALNSDAPVWIIDPLDGTYYRTLVWDHAPGILIAEEAGGFVRRFDGTEYSPLDSRKGLLCAANKEMWVVIQKTLVPTISVVVSSD